MSTFDATKLQRLWELYQVAKQLKFSAYPAHGSGYVTTVTGGNINDLEAAIEAVDNLTVSQ
jgi:hypothetical protein